MIDLIIRLTLLMVIALATANVLQTSMLIVRFVRHVARQPHCGHGLWVPVFASMADIRGWLGAWRRALASPALLAVRADARAIVNRHLHLAFLSHSWAIAVSTLLPQLS